MSKVEVNTVEPQCGTTLTLGGSGDTVALGSGASQTGFGRTGTVDWNTTKITADPANAVSGTGYFCDTSGGAFTVTLPTSPSAGDIVAVADYTRTFATNKLTIGRSSKPIGGIAVDAELTVNGQSATFVFVDDTEGWININETQTSVTGVPPFVSATGGTPCAGAICGDYKIHTFTGPGTLCVSNAGTPSGSDTVEYLVVAGGGGGGASYGGGGGAGGFRFASPSGAPLTYPAKPLAAPANLPVSVQGYPIEVGAGGPGSTANPAANSAKGSNSIFSSITSSGGGAGAYTTNGSPGGSGGGGSVSGSPAPGSVGTTGTASPTTSPAQGTAGGNAYCGAGYRSGGGGGAVCAGTPSPNGCAGGDGGDGGGVPTIFGSNGVPCGSFQYYAGGGGGGGHNGGGLTAVPGGKGGGGATSYPAPGVGVDGLDNTGGGGGGGNMPQADNYAGGSGGSGVVIIRYKFQ